MLAASVIAAVGWPCLAGDIEKRRGKMIVGLVGSKFESRTSGLFGPVQNPHFAQRLNPALEKAKSGDRWSRASRNCQLHPHVSGRHHRRAPLLARPQRAQIQGPAPRADIVHGHPSPRVEQPLRQVESRRGRSLRQLIPRSSHHRERAGVHERESTEVSGRKKPTTGRGCGCLLSVFNTGLSRLWAWGVGLIERRQWWG